MTDQSPEPRDPWAPPERPAVDLGKQQAAPVVPGPPSVHDQQTVAGMPGAGALQPAPQPAPTPTPVPSAPPAYGYPAQPDPGGYGYPAGPSAVPGYGFPGDTGYPGYPGYPGTASYPPYAGPRSNGFGVTALVLGILSVVGCITSVLGIGIGIGAVVFGALGKGKATRGEADNGGMALAGIILGAIGIVLGALMLLAMFAPFMKGEWDGDSRYDSPYSNSREREKI
ncbi:hypothetical protein ACIPUC_32785 [Streptomyces sp. LARHCF249]